MSSDEKKELQTIIITLADPVGNWPFAWKRLCEMADLEPKQCPLHFKPHPILDKTFDVGSEKQTFAASSGIPGVDSPQRDRLLSAVHLSNRTANPFSLEGDSHQFQIVQRIVHQHEDAVRVHPQTFTAQKIVSTQSTAAPT